MSKLYVLIALLTFTGCAKKSGQEVTYGSADMTMNSSQPDLTYVAPDFSVSVQDFAGTGVAQDLTTSGAHDLSTSSSVDLTSAGTDGGDVPGSCLATFDCYFNANNQMGCSDQTCFDNCDATATTPTYGMDAETLLSCAYTAATSGACVGPCNSTDAAQDACPICLYGNGGPCATAFNTCSSDNSAPATPDLASGSHDLRMSSPDLRHAVDMAGGLTCSEVYNCYFTSNSNNGCSTNGCFTACDAKGKQVSYGQDAESLLTCAENAVAGTCASQCQSASTQCTNCWEGQCTTELSTCNGDT